MTVERSKGTDAFSTFLQLPVVVDVTGARVKAKDKITALFKRFSYDDRACVMRCKLVEEEEAEED